MPPRPQDPKNAKQALRHLHASYNGLVAFLRAHGAMLARTRTRTRARAPAPALPSCSHILSPGLGPGPSTAPSPSPSPSPARALTGRDARAQVRCLLALDDFLKARSEAGVEVGLRPQPAPIADNPKPASPSPCLR